MAETKTHRMITTRKRILAAFGVWVATQAPSLAAEATNVLWQIGHPDHSYAEFAIAANYSAFASKFDRQPLAGSFQRFVGGVESAAAAAG